MLPALESGADVVLTGRVADPSLALAPLAHHFGWTLDDTERFARGTVVGHLLECAGQITGGYYADPGRKDVPGMATLGFPFADVDADGNARLSKVEGTGGMHQPHDGDRAAALRGDRSARLSDAGRHGGFLFRSDHRDRAGHDRGHRRARPQAARHAQGERRLSRGLYRRGRDLLRGRELRRARAVGRRDRQRAAARTIPGAARRRGRHERAAHAADVGRRLSALRGAAARRRTLGRSRDTPR